MRRSEAEVKLSSMGMEMGRRCCISGRLIWVQQLHVATQNSHRQVPPTSQRCDTTAQSSIITHKWQYAIQFYFCRVVILHPYTVRAPQKNHHHFPTTTSKVPTASKYSSSSSSSSSSSYSHHHSSWPLAPYPPSPSPTHLPHPLAPSSS